MAVPGYDKLGDACLMFFSDQRCLFQCLVSDLLGKCIPSLDSFTVVLCGSGVFFLCYHSSVCRLCNFSLFHCLLSNGLSLRISLLDGIFFVVSSCSAVGGLKDSALLGLSFGGLDLLLFGDLLLLASLVQELGGVGIVCRHGGLELAHFLLNLGNVFPCSCTFVQGIMELIGHLFFCISSCLFCSFLGLFFCSLFLLLGFFRFVFSDLLRQDLSSICDRACPV